MPPKSSNTGPKTPRKKTTRKTPNKTPAKKARPGFVAIEGGVLSRKAIDVVLEFQKHYDLDLAFKEVGFTPEEAEKVKQEPRFRKEIVGSQAHAEFATKYNKDAVIAEYFEGLEKVKRAVDEGDTKALNAYANFIKMGLETQGLTRKDDAVKAPSVTINFDMGGGQPAVKVVEGGSDE